MDLLNCLVGSRPPMNHTFMLRSCQSLFGKLLARSARQATGLHKFPRSIGGLFSVQSAKKYIANTGAIASIRGMASRSYCSTKGTLPNLLSVEDQKQFESDFHSTPNDDLIDNEMQDGPADIARARGKEFEDSGNFEEALKEYLFAISVDPDNVINYYMTGVVYYKMRQYEEAFRHFKHACELNPRLVEVHNNLGQCAVKLGRMQEALEAMQQAVKLSPSNAVAHLNLATAYNSLQRYGAANKHYLRAIELSPQQPMPLFTYAQSLREQGKYERAIAFFKLAAKYSPKEAADMAPLIEDCFTRLRATLAGQETTEGDSTGQGDSEDNKDGPHASTRQ